MEKQIMFTWFAKATVRRAKPNGGDFNVQTEGRPFKVSSALRIGQRGCAVGAARPAGIVEC